MPRPTAARAFIGRSSVRLREHRARGLENASPAGTGKTALLRALRSRLPQARYRVHYVKVTDLGKRDLCREIASCVGIRPAGSYPMLVRRLQEDFAEAGVDTGVRPVLVIDDAHDIRLPVMGGQTTRPVWAASYWPMHGFRGTGFDRRPRKQSSVTATLAVAPARGPRHAALLCSRRAHRGRADDRLRLRDAHPRDLTPKSGIPPW